MNTCDQNLSGIAAAQCRELARLFGITAQDLIKAGAPARRSRAGRPPEPSAEQRAALAKCRQLIDFWGISAQDLHKAGVPRGRRPGGSGNSAIKPAPAPVKYRHPSSGLTWSGLGRQPQWLKTALTQEGFRVDELLASRAAA